MALAHNLGFPRIGRQRELKKAVESFWSGDIDDNALREAGRRLRADHWVVQRDAGLDLIPTNDFSFYDHVLDTAVMVGSVPERFQTHASSGDVDLRTYFRMARGDDDAPAMEMTKWFDTNYHFIVPEFSPDTVFTAHATKMLDETREAQALGVPAKPVVLGPISFLWLGKARHAGDFDRLTLLERLVPVYAHVLAELAALGVPWVQVDEPALALELPAPWLAAYGRAFGALAAGRRPKMLLATYFGGIDHVAQTVLDLPVDGIHLDLVRAPEQLAAYAHSAKVLSLGVVDGRNVWRTDLDAALARLRQARDAARTWVAPSCSLLHAPVDVAAETKLDAELRSWLAFSVQKLGEVKALAGVLGGAAPGQVFQEARRAVAARAASPRVTDLGVRARVAALTGDDARRRSPYVQRSAAQHARLDLPPLPTTTIGSFPQTQAIRQARAQHKRGALSDEQYEARIKDEIAFAVREQERLELDVLVHGEAERNDMVEYFGEQLRGFAFTENGWVQSYGSRCVKPPIVFGDVARPTPMTVAWSTYAQSLTKRPMKGMLTGPVTILQWSFVRDDQPRSQTALEIALAIRDEVADLERAGIGIVQIDEPALREGLPLRRSDWDAYLKWAVRAFRVASSGAADETQVHTHMCYSEFNDIVAAIADLDADVITVESSRSDMELLEAFRAFRYPNEIGPGVYDIHSPRVPSADEVFGLLRKALAVIPASQLWVNPDCGLKTRRWEEVTPSLEHMVAAAKRVRAEAAAKT